MNGRQVEQVARSFWSSRPRRPRNGRKVAGVAAGVGERYGIDPVIVRVAIAVATVFGGSGLLLYLLGWLFFPNGDDEVSAFEAMINKGQSSVSTGFTAVLCLALIPVCSWFFGGTWFFSGHFAGFLGLLCLFGGLYLLHHGRGSSGIATTTGATTRTTGNTTPAEQAQAAATGTSEATSAADAGERESQVTPPAWDPLGAAPFAWDLPEPGPAPEPPASGPKRRKSKVGLITLGLVLVSVAICVGFAPLTHGWMTPVHAVGIVLAVVAIGLIAGSFVGGGRGLIVLAVMLGVIGVVGTNAHLGPNSFSAGAGDRDYAPTTLAGVQPRYNLTAGDVMLDLTNLPNSGRTTTSVHDTFGDVTVKVPRNADVTATCAARAGDLDCLGRHAQGLGSRLQATDYGQDGPGGLEIVLDLQTTAGNVEVIRV